LFSSRDPPETITTNGAMVVKYYLLYSLVFFPTSFLTLADYDGSEGNIASPHSLEILFLLGALSLRSPV